MVGFDWAQFCALFGAIRKGEERSDNGMGKSGGTSGTSRIVSLVFSFGMIAPCCSPAASSWVRWAPPC